MPGRGGRGGGLQRRGGAAGRAAEHGRHDVHPPGAGAAAGGHHGHAAPLQAARQLQHGPAAAAPAGRARLLLAQRPAPRRAGVPRVSTALCLSYNTDQNDNTLRVILTMVYRFQNHM